MKFKVKIKLLTFRKIHGPKSTIEKFIFTTFPNVKMILKNNLNETFKINLYQSIILSKFLSIHQKPN